VSAEPVGGGPALRHGAIARLIGALRGFSTLAVVVLTLAAPLALNDPQISVYVLIGLSAMVVVGLSLLMGYAGQIALGQGVFYAVGAYVAAILTKHGAPALAGLAAAPVVTAGVAMVIGLPLLRLRGHYLAFGTLATQLIALSLIGQGGSLTGGDTGLTGIPDLSVGPLQFSGRYRAFEYAYAVWVACAIVLVTARNLIRSRPGRGLRALATSESGALSAGVPVTRYKMWVFALSAAYAGLAGALYAFFFGYIAPEAFPVQISIQFLLMAVVGGLSAVWGAVAGAALITLLDQYLISVGAAPGMPPQLPVILTNAAFATIMILVVHFLPRGILPEIRHRFQLLQRSLRGDAGRR
jgi:branched-chain amino acid transport system permease protein